MFTGKAAQGTLDDLPAAFDQPAQSQRSQVLDVNGDVLAYFYDENRIYVPLDKIAPVMRQAQHRDRGPPVLRARAAGRRGHPARAGPTNVAAGGVTQGGSSLTQQYVKMVQIEACQARPATTRRVKAAQDDSYGRKIRELRYAIALEKTLTKDQILERYLNIAYYGDGAYGVEAAAQHYFGTTRRQDSPCRRRPCWPVWCRTRTPTTRCSNPTRGAGAARRGAQPDGRARRDHRPPRRPRPSEGEVRQEEGQPTTINGCVGHRVPVPLRLRLPHAAADHRASATTVEERENNDQARRPDDPDRDRPEDPGPAQKAVSKVVGPTDPLISTMNMIQPGHRPDRGDGAEPAGDGLRTPRRARPTGTSPSTPAMGGVQGYQAGSTFKAFTAAAALEKGIPLSKRYNAARDDELLRRGVRDLRRPRARCTGSWRVEQLHRHQRQRWTCTGRRACSVNTYFVQLELDIGMCRVTKMAEKLGVKSGTPDRDLVELLPATSRRSPSARSRSARCRWPRRTRPSPPAASTATRSSSSRSPPHRQAKLEVPSANCKRVISKDVADGMNRLLSSVMTKGTGTRAPTCRRPAAGRQDRHHRQQRGGLVRRLHPADRRRRDDLASTTRRSRSSEAAAELSLNAV